MMSDDGMPLADYRALAELRYQIRRFLHFSEREARRAGLEPQQHQALLTLKGLPADRAATIGELAERLQIAHHSAVELVDRLADRGLVQRTRGAADRRQVLLALTPAGTAVLRELSLQHRAELRQAGPALQRALNALLAGDVGDEPPPGDDAGEPSPLGGG
ncbi:MAG TPA: MarR family transcriptional regulator [Chloroflexota bacterium]|nr:MarR family transcriptional regulator [Chloroflexota bacterium]